MKYCLAPLCISYYLVSGLRQEDRYLHSVEHSLELGFRFLEELVPFEHFLTLRMAICPRPGQADDALALAYASADLRAVSQGFVRNLEPWLCR